MPSISAVAILLMNTSVAKKPSELLNSVNLDRILQELIKETKLSCM